MFEIIQVSAFSCQCEKCGHKWISYREDLPTHCANRICSNPTKWNSPGKSRFRRNPRVSGGRERINDDERIIVPIDDI